MLSLLLAALGAAGALQAQVNPAQGPGGPILVLASKTNSFSYFYAEILRAEGLNAFAVADVSTVSSKLLSSYDVVVLGDIPLTQSQAVTLLNWSWAGGNLILMRPCTRMGQLLGVSNQVNTISDGYLLVDGSKPPGYGIFSAPMQFHGPADVCAIPGANSIATLYSTISTPAAAPAVALLNFGRGQIAGFAYDLARSIVYTRQGNPAWAGQQRDPSSALASPLTVENLFFGPAPFDPQPNWNDFRNIAVPQADEQQRLFANLILQMELQNMPLPRFWYLPFGYQAVVNMTGDDHAVGGTAGRFDQYLSASPAGCSVANWQCVRGTSYIYPNSPLTRQQYQNYTSQGFEVGLHVTTNCLPWVPATLDAAYFIPQLTAWQAGYSPVPPVSNRTHCVVWSDWATQAKVELSHGMRFDVNYDYWPSTWVQGPGLFTGSGFPMRFGDTDGSLIDVYQGVTDISDTAFSPTPSYIDALLDRALSVSGYYGVFTVLAHTDAVPSFLSDTVIASAKTRYVPVVSSAQVLNWIDGRNNSLFGSLSWSRNTLTFTVTVGATANGLQVMVPRLSQNGILTNIALNGNSVRFVLRIVKGVEYAIIPANAGRYSVTYGAGAVSVSISAPAITLYTGQQKVFQATVNGSSNPTILWSILPNVGTIDQRGLYTAPPILTAPQTVTIKAASAADPTKSATAMVTLLPKAAPVLTDQQALWTFDGSTVLNTQVLDLLSQGADTCNITGPVTSVAGRVKQAGNFDGVSAYLSCPTDVYSKFAGNLTVAAWISTRNTTRNEAIFSRYDLNGNEAGYIFRTTPDGHIGLRVGAGNLGAGASDLVDTGARINDGNWHHVAVVIAYGQSVQFYVDGRLSSVQTQNAFFGQPPGGVLQIGLSPNTSYGTYFNGYLDELTYFTTALSADQIELLSVQPQPAAVAVFPPSKPLSLSQSQQFTAVLNGVPSSSVIWSISPNTGTISPSGLYTAPAITSPAQFVTITATSTANFGQSSTALVTLTGR